MCGYTRAPVEYATSISGGNARTKSIVSATVSSVSPGSPKMSPSSALTPCSVSRAMRSSRCRRRNGFCASVSTFSAALSTVIETSPFVSRTSSASSAENGVGLKYARHVTVSARPRSTSPRSTAIGCFSSGRLNSSSAKKIGTRPMPRPFADSTVCSISASTVPRSPFACWRIRFAAVQYAHCIAQPMRVRTGKEFAGA